MMRSLTKNHAHSAACGQRGQALTEFLVMSVALIPLFLLVPMIAKYQDISHATQMASRYAAFDATTRNDIQSADGWKPEAQLADEVRRRFFSNSNAPMKTGDVAGDFTANRNVFWRDPFGSPLIPSFSDVAVSFGTTGATHAAGFSGASDGTPFNVIPIANAANMGLQARGVYTANVAVALAKLPAGLRSIEPFDQLDLRIRRHTSLVFEPWSSPSPAETENRFGKLAPLNSALEAIEPLIALAIVGLELGEVAPPKFGRLEKWRDVVPADRLKPPE